MLEQDEAQTLAGLRDFRSNIFNIKTANHNGKIVKNMGDGWLVEFNSALDCVSCATEIQEALVNHELIKLRIGIHVGDIVHEDNDIFGEGVNVAARLEQLAEPGSVLISDVVHRFIDRKTDHEFMDLGKHDLKNISREQRIYGWAPEASNCILIISKENKKFNNQEDTSQLLLFETFRISGSKEEAAEVAEDLQYELILVLSRRTGLKVVSERIEGINPNHILGGRIRVSGENLRIDITISDGTSGASIWVERFTNVLDEVDDLVIEVRNKVSVFSRNMTSAFSGASYGNIPGPRSFAQRIIVQICTFYSALGSTEHCDRKCFA